MLYEGMGVAVANLIRDTKNTRGLEVYAAELPKATSGVRSAKFFRPKGLDLLSH